MTTEYLKRLDDALDEVLDLFNEGAWDDIIDHDLSQIGIGRDIIRIARKYGVTPRDLNNEPVEYINEFVDSGILPKIPEERIEHILQALGDRKIPCELRCCSDVVQISSVITNSLRRLKLRLGKGSRKYTGKSNTNNL